MGIVLGPLLLGFICMAAYLWMRQRKTLFSVFFGSLLSFCVTISIFVNHFTQIGTWYFVVVGYVVYRYCYSTEEHSTEMFRRRVYG